MPRTTEELLKDAEKIAALLDKTNFEGDIIDMEISEITYNWFNKIFSETPSPSEIDIFSKAPEMAVLISELVGKLREREAQREALDKALDNLVGTNGCLGWIIGKENIDDALLFRGGQLPIKNFAKEFQPMLYEVIHAGQEALQVLNQQRTLPTPPKQENYDADR